MSYIDLFFFIKQRAAYEMRISDWSSDVCSSDLFGLWRLNWLHPFIEGNGRTARAACYFLLCVRSGALLPGRKIVPERIKEDWAGYERALFADDRAWDTGHLDFSVMEDYLATLLKPQLADNGLD